MRRTPANLCRAPSAACGAWEFFRDIGGRGSQALPALQRREAESRTPSRNHDTLAGTSTSFAGGTVFGAGSFAAGDTRATDAGIAKVGTSD